MASFSAVSSIGTEASEIVLAYSLFLDVTRSTVRSKGAEAPLIMWTRGLLQGWIKMEVKAF